MTTLTNSFEGGTSGTVLSAANSGGASGSPFDVVAIGAAATLAYDATHVAHGSLSCKAATGASSSTALAEWTTSMGTQATVYFRMYVYLAGTPTPPFRAYSARSAATHAGSVLFTGTTIRLDIGAAFTAGVTFTAQPPLNQWFRFEGFVTGDPAAGAISGALYTPQDSTIPAETHTVTGLNTVGALTQYWFGQGNNSATSGPFWLDSVGISSTGRLGPATSRAAASIVPSLIAAGAI